MERSHSLPSVHRDCATLDTARCVVLDADPPEIQICVLPSLPEHLQGLLLAHNFEHFPNHFQQNYYSLFQSDHEVTQMSMFSQVIPDESSPRVIKQPCEHLGEDGEMGRTHYAAHRV